MSKLKLLRVLFGTIACAVLVACTSEVSPEASAPADLSVGYRARVIKVVDGDTVWVKPAGGGSSRKLRIVGLDAPEICQSGGRVSRDVLARRILDQQVTVDEGEKDRYGRPLAHVYHDNEDVAAWLVLSGYAWSYRYKSDEGLYADEEIRARDAGRGIFARPDAMEPRQFRKAHGPCH